jgi:hypothetical protein
MLEFLGEIQFIRPKDNLNKNSGKLLAEDG